MKVNAFLTLISILLTGLLGYWIYDVARGKEHDILCGICSSVCILSTIIPIIGLQYETGRMSINIRAFSGLFFTFFLISHFCYAAFGIKMPSYMILNGIILAIYLTILYKILSIKDI